MKLFHCFPRTREANNKSQGDLALRILTSILKFGILCTPEKLNIYPDKNTTNKEKIDLIKKKQPEFIYQQSRFCMSLCTENDIYNPEIYSQKYSHAHLFGPFAISFDPKISRILGIMPTTYFTPSDIFGEEYSPNMRATPGLSLQIIQRLKELRDILVILALIEHSLVIEEGFSLPGLDILKQLNLDNLPFETEAVDKTLQLTAFQRKKIFELFNTDRLNAFDMIGYVEMMFSLFQETDSSIDGASLAFYQQREWRLIHHMRHGMKWYCLGRQPAFKNPHLPAKINRILEIRKILKRVSGHNHLSEKYFSGCWLLEEVDGLPVKEYISSIITPADFKDDVRRIAENLKCRAKIYVAEDFGYSENTN